MTARYSCMLPVCRLGHNAKVSKGKQFEKESGFRESNPKLVEILYGSRGKIMRWSYGMDPSLFSCHS